MPTLQQLRTRVDNYLASTVWPLVLARQEAYLTANGNYWQGLVTHNVYPAHTTAAENDTAPDRLEITPGDVPEGWLDVLPELDTSLPAAFVMDVYDGPLGHGFVASLYMRRNGILYSRSQNYGPETWRTVGWHEVNELPVI